MEEEDQGHPAQVLQRLGGIIGESYRLLRTYARLFAALTATLILPLCFMLLAHHLVSGPLVHRIRHNEAFVQRHEGSSDADVREGELEREWTELLLFFAAYLLLVLGFSLLSTAAVVYSVACIYAHKGVSYLKVLSVVPTVWRRLLFTFIWIFGIIVTYHVVSIGIFVSVRAVISDMNIVFVVLALAILVVLLMAVHISISCIWHLASVISVLEESYGFAALRRSFDLIKGKRLLAFTLFFIYLVVGGLIGLFFHVFVLHHHRQGGKLLVRLVLGMVLVFLLSFVTLFGMLAQTVFYFACKSFHNERIDWPTLSEHLGAYLGEYVPLKSSIQMEAFEIGEA